jgi:hypothetical protein
MNLGYFFIGLGLAKGLTPSGQAKNILFIIAVTYISFILPKGKSNKKTEDTAVLISLSLENDVAEIGDFNFGTDGKRAGNLILKIGQ